MSGSPISYGSGKRLSRPPDIALAAVIWTEHSESVTSLLGAGAGGENHPPPHYNVPSRN